MKKSILITGVSGSGKSEVSRQLKVLGYETYDMDTIDELCVMIEREGQNGERTTRTRRNYY